MNQSTHELETITVNDIVQYFYCPRKVYFLKTMQLPFKPRKKMVFGLETQEKEKERVKERIDVYGFEKGEVETINLNIEAYCKETGLKGKIDVLLKLKNGEHIPVEIKYTEKPIIQRPYKKQVIAYATLTDCKYKTTTKTAIIYFSKQKISRKINVSREDKETLKRDIEKIRKLLTNEKPPRKTSREKCGYCEVKKYCV